jgi:hypothetical protein
MWCGSAPTEAGAATRSFLGPLLSRFAARAGFVTRRQTFVRCCQSAMCQAHDPEMLRKRTDDHTAAVWPCAALLYPSFKIPDLLLFAKDLFVAASHQSAIGLPKGPPSPARGTAAEPRNAIGVRGRRPNRAVDSHAPAIARFFAAPMGTGPYSPVSAVYP